MSDIKWGAKRKCAECETSFYDMQRTPITCPKCGAVHRPVALLKADGRPPRKNRVRPPAPLPSQAVDDPVKEASNDPRATEDAESGDEAEDDDTESAEENQDEEENEDDEALEPNEAGR